jgi:DNA modification methylase
MSILLIGDCLEELTDIQDNSVDLIFCDLPYGQTSCKWDSIIPIDKLWIEFMRIKKLNTPIIMTTTTKFGLSLLNSCPKKCPFRYDLVWCKSATCGFLSAKKMPMRKHEMLYVFYEKLPFYDLSSHTHKFIKDTPIEVKNNSNKNSEIYGDIKDNGYYKLRKKGETTAYEPPLPTSLIKENSNKNSELYGDIKGNGYTSSQRKSNVFDPPLPNSLLEIKSTRGKHSTEKPVALMSWILKYYSKEGDVVLDPTMGSGSMGVACKEMKRNFIGIEKDEEIYKVAVNRIGLD